MTCQHCQTWILDDEHRCSRCGRRVRSTPGRVSPSSYPIAATANALAYDGKPQYGADDVAAAQPGTEGQQVLFDGPVGAPTVIPFDSLTSPAEREAIRARAKEITRPSPVKTAKVAVNHARPRQKRSGDQRRFEFLGSEQVLEQPEQTIICDAPVAPAAMRVQAALIDSAIVFSACAIVCAVYATMGGAFSMTKQVLPYIAAVLLTVALLYKTLWAFAGRDSIGMRVTGLRLVDFDGNPPAQARRYARLFGSALSVLAAGVGLVWALVDEDKLTWHDHVSSTFPTLRD